MFRKFVLAAALFLRAFLTRQRADFNAIRLTLARCLFHGYKWVPATIIVFGIPVPFPSRSRPVPAARVGQCPSHPLTDAAGWHLGQHCHVQ